MRCASTLTRFVLKKKWRNITREKNLIACLIIMHDWHKIYWNQLVLIGVAAGFETFRFSSIRSLPHLFVIFVTVVLCCCYFICTCLDDWKNEIVYKMDSRKCFSYFITYLLYRLMVVISVFRDRLRFLFFFFSFKLKNRKLNSMKYSSSHTQIKIDAVSELSNKISNMKIKGIFIWNFFFGYGILRCLIFHPTNVCVNYVVIKS